VPKTTPPGKVVLDHGTFEANAVPDVFDSRDLAYRSRLSVLPKTVDCRPEDRYVLKQDGSSCTGHAVAAMVNAILASQSDPTHVSPYMLYALARRYDEFEGDADVGSSLRGALKGWYYHGVLPDKQWPALDMAPEPDLDGDEAAARMALERPLGAFYRVNATRLDDMQSAITELFGIVVSAAVHDGWYQPVEMTKTVDGTAQTMSVITRTESSQAVGGHAFCLVGYNEVGFLVQNSWGSEWGHHGFATLPYDDWLESGHDAWVARPGVPSIVSRRVRSKLLNQPGGGLVEGPGPDLEQLAHHVVNLGDQGRLSQNGKFVSTKTQLEKLAEHMAATHAQWGKSPRRVVLYAHGGLDSEKTGLDIAQRQVNWWLSNEVYPISFAWETGVTETLQDQLSDLFARRVPADGFSFDVFEQVDRLVEKSAKRTLRWIWDEMKDNASSASDPLPAQWESVPDHELPGGSVLVALLRRYLDDQADVPTQIHLVGHSAGSILLTGLIERLATAAIEIESLTYLAAAMRTDAWMSDVLPHLRERRIKRFTAFGLTPTRELDDVCGAAGLTVYRKSLLYLVSRAFERPTAPETTEVPLVGMARFADEAVKGTSLAQAVASLPDADLAWSPSAAPPDLRTDSSSHGGFDDDTATMTSVLLRILRSKTVQPGNEYVPNLPPGTSSAAVAEAATEVADQPPEIVTAEVSGADAPHPDMAAAAPASGVATRSAVRAPGYAAARSGNRVLDGMMDEGWEVSEPSSLAPDAGPR
jgi:hypothetical protein